MPSKHAPAKKMPPAKKAPSTHLRLDEAALKAAKSSLDDGAVTPHNDGPWVKDIIKLLNDSLATELVCVLRYKRHHYMADGLASPKIAEKFLVHAQEEAAHADRIPTRIVQLGGEPNYNSDTLTQRSHADYNDSNDLTSCPTRDAPVSGPGAAQPLRCFAHLARTASAMLSPRVPGTSVSAMPARNTPGVCTAR